MMKVYKILQPGYLLGLTLALLVASAPLAHAQFGYNPTGVTTTTGTYTDLGTNGLAITTANTDDANSAAQSIGFNFVYNGATFNQFVLNTNGLMRLGGAAPSKAAACSPYGQAAELGPINSTDPADVNLIMPFNFDLTAGTSTPEYRVYTSGTTGSRICTIQWKNVADKAVPTSATTAAVQATQYANFSFQVQLYEGSNRIDFVYNAPTAATGASAVKLATVGLKGSRGDIGSDVVGNKISADAWAAAVFYTFVQPAGNAFNFRQGVPPAAGFTYRFAACTPATITTFPYSETFNGVPEGALPCGASGTDANSDDYTWETIDFGSSSVDNILTYVYNDTDPTVGANDWYYTPALSLRAGYTYQLQFDYAVIDPSISESLEVKWGSAATPAGQTATLFSNTNITNDAFVTTTPSQVTIIKPTTTGIYYIGFHATSAPDSYVLGVDNIQITEAQALAVKNGANTLFSAEASPVPFSTNLNLNLTTREAGALHLTLRDALGRTLRQTTATATVGSSNIAVPGVADLPAGVYFLDVEQAGQKQMLRVTHE